MTKYISTILIILLGVTSIKAQTTNIEGSCGDGLKWYFDGTTLTISNVNKGFLPKPMNDFNMKKNISPWRKKKLDIKRVQIGKGVTSIGSCAFANCGNLTEVIFHGNEVYSIGWGAFLNCYHLRTITLPLELNSIEKIAFANCHSLNTIKIPSQCRVEDQAFVSCNNLQSIDIPSTVVLGQQVFAKEENIGGIMQHTPYSGNILRLPPYINENNCNLYGLAKEAVDNTRTSGKAMEEDYDLITSEIDSNIPASYKRREDTYVLIIGNQNYRFVSDVPYAIHDARVFGEYCKKTLGVPEINIHITENATKQMILEEELEDWVAKITNPENKKLIIYYAGHGVPDTEDGNKSYILPTDVRGENPKRGIALDEFYAKIGRMSFAQTSFFIDACFSGVNRNNDGVTKGLRGVAIKAKNVSLQNNNIVVFSAAQGNETAQGYPEQGHGLFTYYLLKELNESSGNIKFGDLSDNLIRNVSEKAGTLQMRKKQTPSTKASDNLIDWRNLVF